MRRKRSHLVVVALFVIVRVTNRASSEEPIERLRPFVESETDARSSFASSVYDPRLTPRVSALARCVRDHSSLSRGHRRRGREPLCSRSRWCIRLLLSLFVSDVDTTCANADTCARLRCAERSADKCCYSSNNISSHRRRCRRRGRSPTTAANFISTNVSAVASRARSSASSAPNARVAASRRRVLRWSRPVDTSTERRPRLVSFSFSFSFSRPHRHLFPRRSRARVQRSLCLCFKRERYRHRARAARFVDVVVVLCARDSSSRHSRRGETNRGVRFRNDAGDDFVKRGTRSRVGNGETNEIRSRRRFRQTRDSIKSRERRNEREIRSRRRFRQTRDSIKSRERHWIVRPTVHRGNSSLSNRARRARGRRRRRRQIALREIRDAREREIFSSPIAARFPPSLVLVKQT